MFIISIIRSIYAVLNPIQKRKMLFLQLFFAFSAVVQVVGVASIAPFITLVSNPGIIHTNKIYEWLYINFDFASNNQFIIAFALASLATILISNFVSALTLWLLLRFSVAIGTSLQSELYKNYLHRDYIFHKTSNHTQIISVISQEAPRFVYMVLQPFLLLSSQAFIAAVILFGLIFMNPVIAFASGALIGGSYLLTYIFVKKSLIRHGALLTERNKNIQSILAESFIGIKDIKLNSLEKSYVHTYNDVNHQGLNSTAYIALSGDLPKFVIETISFGAILLLAIILLLVSKDESGVISVLSIYAIAGYKLLPTMQQIYKSISSMSANGGVVSALKKALDYQVETNKKADAEPFGSVNRLCVKDIDYHYPNTAKAVLNKINLNFELGKLNTIAGPSGSGKSTLADIMLGLLTPQNGNLELNGEPLLATQIQSYQRTIGYVPQSIFILDDTVVANVAFGIPKENIDLTKVEDALKQANALEFVEKLPRGIHSGLGQDGKLLSGGQRQRIGIARALYRNTKILILDEPTSALDIDSEYDLMMLLARLKTNTLIIVISHRPAAIKLSDNIVLLENGMVSAAGSFELLQNTSEHFKEMMEKGMVQNSPA